MRRIDTSAVIPVIRQLCIEACQQLSSNVTDALRDARAREESPLCQEILDMLLENAAFASENHLSCCQDTGMTVVLLEIGQEVCWEGMPLYDAVNEGVRQGYRDGYLRKSVVDDPLLRKNTGDNTPAMIHVDIVPGDKVTITILPKGAGSENMSALYMLTPADGVQGVKKAVMEAVERAGGKPCPPIVVGIGLGGTMDKAAFLSKKALLLLPDGCTLYGDASEIIREDHLEAAFGIPVRIRTVHLPERDYTCVMAIGPSQHR